MFHLRYKIVQTILYFKGKAYFLFILVAATYLCFVIPGVSGIAANTPHVSIAHAVNIATAFIGDFIEFSFIWMLSI